MVHNILYCKVHDKYFHGLRPIGMHNTLHEIPHWRNPDWLVDLGLCPFFSSYSIQTRMHQIYLDRWNAIIEKILVEKGFRDERGFKIA